MVGGWSGVPTSLGLLATLNLPPVLEAFAASRKAYVRPLTTIHSAVDVAHFHWDELEDGKGY